MSNFKFLLKNVLKTLFEVASFCQKYFINRTKSLNFSVIYWITFLFLLFIFFFFFKAVFFGDIFCDVRPDDPRLHISVFHFKINGEYFTFVAIDLYQDTDLKDILEIGYAKKCRVLILEPNQALIQLHPSKTGVWKDRQYFSHLPKRFWWTNEITRIRLVEREGDLILAVSQKYPLHLDKTLNKSV